MKLFLAPFLSAVLAVNALGASIDEIPFGPEWEFGRRDLFQESFSQSFDYMTGKSMYWGDAGPISETILEEVAESYLELQKDARLKIEVEIERTRARPGKPSIVSAVNIHFKDQDFIINIQADFGVMEVTTTPKTLSEWKKLSPRVQRIVFDHLREKVGLHPGKGMTLGAGHVNMDGNSGFRNDLQLFRNYIVDRVNHGELANGIQYGLLDKINAPPLAKDEALYEKLIEYLKKLDRGTWKNVGSAAAAYNRIVFGVEDPIAGDNGKAYRPDKYRADRVHTSGEGRSIKLNRIENRATRYQENVDEFILQADLLQHRLVYLQDLDEDVELLPRKEILKRINSTERYQQYVEEAGLSWARYRKEMPLVFKCLDFFTKWF